MLQEYRKKLIEVALPLEAINEASRREKSPFTRHHPRALHVWWARRPLVACRAVLFASLIDDPSAWPELFSSEEEQEVERKRLFGIIEQLVRWENSNNETVLFSARTEVARSISRNLDDEMPEGDQAIREYLAEKAPAVLDPFCGGGSIPIEAQRLGLRAMGSDLNPLAVLITKSLIQIPPIFTGFPPVNPKTREDRHLTEKDWKGAEGLAEDVRYYGRWIRDEAENRIGYVYPRVKIDSEMAKERTDLANYAGHELRVNAWLWARTVKCPNPACGAQMPLVKSFRLSTKTGKEAWIVPHVDQEEKSIRFSVRTGSGTPPQPPKVSRGAKFKCLVCGQLAEDRYIKEEGIAGKILNQLMAIVAEGQRSNVYLSPSDEQAAAAHAIKPSWIPEQPLSNDPRNIWCLAYGIDTFDKLFTDRQLAVLAVLCELVDDVREQVLKDAAKTEILHDDSQRLAEGGTGRVAYADAIATYLACAVSRLTDFSNTICSWDSGNTNMRQLFARQAIPMSWDFAETNVIHGVVDIIGCVDWVTGAFEELGASLPGSAEELDAVASIETVSSPMISTDPPYYDNIAYSVLSDFFYVWLRRMLSKVFPKLFSTLLTPKDQELIASPYRHDGSKSKAEQFFEEGLGSAFHKMWEAHDNSYPLVVYYGFKQSETDKGSGNIASTGWETMLQGLIRAGFCITGTWPMRTEQQQRSVALGTNALASSIILACRKRLPGAPLGTRREFISALKEELPEALANLQHGNIAPVDLAQASIGPGMAIFTRYSKVIESDGSPMSIRIALGLINQTLDDVLAEQEGEFDSDTRWAISWFEQHCMEEGPFGDAETLSKAKDTAVGGLVEAGILEAEAGKVRLLGRDELIEDWDPTEDNRYTAWEASQYLIRALDQHGEAGAAQLLRMLGGGHGEAARDLAYRLYNICERKGWASEALAYNSLVIAWPEITRLARASTAEGFGPQTEMFETK